MTLRRPLRYSGARLMGITMLILGMLRIPLPQVDFHSIRHYHQAGEICPYHDHLLRWHPSASANEDVAVLHWHWLPPGSEDDKPTSSGGDDHTGPASGPALHAHFADLLEPDRSGEPVILPDHRGRFLLGTASGFSTVHPAHVLAQRSPVVSVSSACGDFPGIEPSRPLTGLLGLCQRWNC